MGSPIWQKYNVHEEGALVNNGAYVFAPTGKRFLWVALNTSGVVGGTTLVYVKAWVKFDGGNIAVNFPTPIVETMPIGLNQLLILVANPPPMIHVQITSLTPGQVLEDLRFGESV